MIGREEMQEIAKSYQKPIGPNLGSHSAPDTWMGQRDHGIKTIIYTPQKAKICLQNQMAEERILT
ncbi:MAG: hypothetical protein ACE5L6_08530 [Candidatus Bathyarchaeia archaeon]